MKYITYLTVLLLLFSSCVSTKKYEEQIALSKKYLAEKKDCAENLAITEREILEKEAHTKKLMRENNALTQSNKSLEKTNEQLTNSLKTEKNLKEKTHQDLDKYMKSFSEKQESLRLELAEKERELNQKESDIHNVQLDLEEQKAQLLIYQNEINLKESTLSQKTKQIEELEAKLNEQSMAISSLRTQVSKALKEFTSEELLVEEKEGKVYVSLSEKLLFKPGHFTLDKNGEEALEKLAEVLSQQQDVDIIVEGHADSDPYIGKGDLIDNLDLSAKRASSVTRVLIQNKVPKDKILAAGRGDSKPIASNDTKEGKAKNRRTEIILSPNLEKLFELIQSQ